MLPTVPVSSSTSPWAVSEDVAYSTGADPWQQAALNLLLENVAELRWPQAGDVFARMRWDGQLQGSLKATTLPIRRAYWALDDAGCRPTATRFVADQLGLPILGKDGTQSGARRRGFQFADHLRVAITLVSLFGHAPFERVYDTTTGTRATLGTVQERLPSTIRRILVATDGSIDYVEQNRYAGTPEPPKIRSDALLWYVNDRLGVGWRGESMLRSAYPYWVAKDFMLRVLAASNQRWGMGVPYIEDQPGASPQEHEENARYAQRMRAGDQAGTAVPNGAKLAVAGVTGSLPDTLGFIKYLDSQMSVAFLTQWLNLGNTETGARALAEVFVDTFMQSIQDLGDSLAEQATAGLVVPLVDLNFGENEPAPRVVCGNVGANRALTAAAIAALYTSGALSGDPELENAIRELYKLPLRPPTPVTPPAPTAPPTTDPPPPEPPPTGAA